MSFRLHDNENATLEEIKSELQNHKPFSEEEAENNLDEFPEEDDVS